MKHKELLEEVISKGGVIGAIGKKYLHSDDLCKAYLVELSNQIGCENCQRLWGEKIINELRKFRSVNVN